MSKLTQDFTREYFSKELLEFRNLFGSLSFWQQPPAKRQIAVDAIAFVYLNTNAVDDTEEELIETLFEATIREYTLREGMLSLAKKVNWQL